MKKFAAIVLLSSVFVSVSLADGLRVAIINAAGVDAGTLEALRSYAERELFVPVDARDDTAIKGNSLQEIGKSAAARKQANDVCMVVLVNSVADERLHAKIMTNEQVAVVNVAALRSEDPVKSMRRLQRWTLRGTAFLFGIGPDFDPHCVMHDYVTLEELDKLGLNFSPPWMEMVRKAAGMRGLDVRPLVMPLPCVGGKAKPR